MQNYSNTIGIFVLDTTCWEIKSIGHVDRSRVSYSQLRCSASQRAEHSQQDEQI
jgi:hypothetical protein